MSASEDDPMALHEGDEDETDESDLDHEMIQEDDGFIVNDDDAEQDYDTSVYFKVNREKKRKARRIQNDEDEDENELDEEDRLLVEENTGIQFARKLKKLKRGRDRMAVDQSTRADHDLDKIFEQDYIENQEEEFNDFIEDDEDNDDEDNRDRHDARKQERQGRTHPPPPMAAARLTGGVDQVHDIADIFHDRDGQEFGWALDEEEEEETRPLGGIDSLKEVFEPGELQAKMMTDQDEEIRILDVPERMQLAWIAHDIKADPTIAAKDPYPTYVEEDVMRETAFIVKKLLHDPALAFIADQLEELVRITLKFFYKERLEVPFIHAHRRDYFSRFEMEQETCLLSRDHLWAIWDYSMQFRALKRRKQVLLERCARLATPDMYAHDMVQSATTFEELEDVGYYLRIHYASELRSNTSVKKTDAYITERLKKIATGGILQAFGLSAQEFGENMLAGVKARFVKDVQSTPSIEASQYANLYHDSAEKVLLAGRLAYEQQLAGDPQVRRSLRTFYQEHAAISVMVTELGREAIDESHKYCPFKYLRNKPFAKFEDEQFLLISQAAKEGLVRIVVSVDEAKFIKKGQEMLESESADEFASEWNKLRRDMLQRAYDSKMHPLMEKWVKERLHAMAEEYVGKQVYEAFFHKMNMQPSRSDKQKSPRVAAVSWGYGDPRKDGVHIAFVSGRGKLADSAVLPDLRTEKTHTHFMELIKRVRPDIILVSGFNACTRRLWDQIQQLVSTAMDTKPFRTIYENGMLPVEYGQDDTARLYMESERAKQEFPQLDELTRYCIGVARRHQRSVNEYASLSLDDLCAFYWHPCQHIISRDRMRLMLERALVNSVNDIGVNINKCIAEQKDAQILSYICGLGPRKATYLLKRAMVVSDGLLEYRRDLIKDGLVTGKVFMNCAAFLRIVPHKDTLDGTRIHPEDYDLARRMAADALDIDYGEGDQDAANASEHIEDLMRAKQWKKLDELQLDDYANKLLEFFHKPKRLTLEKIKHEMRAPWADRRQPYESMTMDQAFTYLTGETDKTLYPGALVHARINKVMDKIMVLTIESGHLDAILTPPYRSDDPNAPQLTELFQPGTSQQFVIHNVDKTKFQVELSARQSDKSHAKDHIHNLYLDAYFSKSAMEEDMRHAQETEKKRQRIVEQTRVVPHPKFKMFNLKQALQHLQPLRPGALVIRPSSKGNDHLTITWKVAPDVYHHIDVEELEKPNAYTLGRRLRIAPYLPYADLDEIIVNHVGELSKRVKTLEDSNRFRNIDKLAMHDWLNARLASEGHNVVYGFCRYDNNRPLHYYLSWKYAPNKPCIDWLVVVERDCYKLRTIEYPDVTSLVAGFKKQATNEFQKAKETRDGRTAGWNVPVEQDKWRPPTDNWGAHSMTGGTSSGW